VRLRIRKGHRLAALCRMAHQALAEREADPSDRGLREAHRRGEHELAKVRSAQVDGADVSVEPLGDEIDDVAQRLAEIVGAGDDPGHVREHTFAVGNARALRNDVASLPDEGSRSAQKPSPRARA
jgi:hypothetical protein